MLISVNVEFEKKIIIIIKQYLAFGPLHVCTFDLWTQYELFLRLHTACWHESERQFTAAFFAFCVPEHCVRAKRKKIKQ